MPWNQFWKRSDRKDNEKEKSEASPPAESARKVDASRNVPPHLASAFAERRRPSYPRDAPDDERRRRLDTLQRRRTAIFFDIQQGEQAEAEDNPWQQRIELLTEALATVSDDLKHLADAPKAPYHPVPATAISIERIEGGDVATVILDIGDERFEYSEDLDWAERGHQITRSELVHRSGAPAHLVPDDTPEELRTALERHLNNSVFVLATDLRDRVLDGEPLPECITLADLARPCPRCGGWMDWRGTCQVCAQRAAATKALKREEVRLLDERAAEVEERHRLIERLPLARRRLRDIDAEIATLTSDS
jgi:hypothetical protein